MTSPTTAPGDVDLVDGLAIADVAQCTGLSKDRLRYHEKAHLIEAVHRSSGGQRRYAVADLQGHLLALESKITHYRDLFDQQSTKDQP